MWPKNTVQLHQEPEFKITHLLDTVKNTLQLACDENESFPIRIHIIDTVMGFKFWLNVSRLSKRQSWMMLNIHCRASRINAANSRCISSDWCLLCRKDRTEDRHHKGGRRQRQHCQMESGTTEDVLCGCALSSLNKVTLSHPITSHHYRTYVWMLCSWIH